MVFVKVRETYDLHTLKNKMTVIGVHTPAESIIKRNYPGLLMQCRAYRPVSCDIRLACASMLPLDPQGVGTTEGDVAPEDVFNPILYKAVSNQSMGLIEQYINRSGYDSSWTARGDILDANNDGIGAASVSSDFDLYYGLLSDTNSWKHAAPQSGLSMTNLKPLVYEQLVTNGLDREGDSTNAGAPIGIGPNGQPVNLHQVVFKGHAKSMPMMNCTITYSPGSNQISASDPGFGSNAYFPVNSQVGVPAPKVMVACICVPPSRLHQLFYRMVCEWTLEFSQIRSLAEITNWIGLAQLGTTTHIQDYNYSESKVLTETTSMVDTTEDSGITKVM